MEHSQRGPNPPEAIAPPGVALAGAYHGEGRAIERHLQNGKARSNRAENLQLTAQPRNGAQVTGPGTPSKGRTFQRRGFHLGKSPSERAQDAAGPGPLERAAQGGQGRKVRIARKRGFLAKGRKTQRAQGHSKGPPGGSGPQVRPVQYLHFHWQSPFLPLIYPPTLLSWAFRV